MKNATISSRVQDQRHSDYTASLCEYLLKENQILRAHTPGKLRLTDEERITLAKIGKQLGRKMRKDVASVAKPETILGWYRRLVAKKFDGSKKRRSPGRPRIDTEIEKLILEIVDKNSDRGYDKVAGALANLGYDVSDQTVGNVLKRHGISPAPKRKGGIGWKEFIKAQAAVTAACDFFTVKCLPCAACSPTTCCFSSTSTKAAECRWRASRAIRTSTGWSRWLGT